jgi:hypothetical protein
MQDDSRKCRGRQLLKLSPELSSAQTVRPSASENSGVDIYEFISKMAEQHGNLLKVIELQNNSIQALNHRANALAVSQLVLFALLLDSDPKRRQQIASNLRLMIANPNIASSPHLIAQLNELLDICEGESSAKPAAPKPAPSWFRGIVQGGLDAPPLKDKSSEST